MPLLLLIALVEEVAWWQAATAAAPELIDAAAGFHKGNRPPAHAGAGIGALLCSSRFSCWFGAVMP